MNKTAISIVFGAFVLAAATYGAWWWNKNFAPVSDGYIRVEVQLINSCPVPSKFFAARSTKTHKMGWFSGDQTTMVVRADEKLELVLDPKFSGVTYAGYKIPVSPQMVLSADCSSSVRQKMVIDTMRKRFNE